MNFTDMCIFALGRPVGEHVMRRDAHFVRGA